MAIVGLNGTGKSTLLKLMTGQLEVRVPRCKDYLVFAFPLHAGRDAPCARTTLVCSQLFGG